MKELTNIQILNGIGLIFMEQIGMKHKKEMVYSEFMENTGIMMEIKKMEIMII